MRSRPIGRTTHRPRIEGLGNPPLNLDDIRAVLRSNRPLPKDARINTGRWGLTLNNYRQRERRLERSLLHALAGPMASSREQEQALAIANCAPGRFCRHWRCWICRQRFYWQRRQRIEELTVDVVPADISFVTAICGVTHDEIEAVQHLIETFRNAWLKRSMALRQVAWLGFIEVDYLLPGVEDIGTFKLKSLMELGYEPGHEFGALVPHLHAAYIHPGRPRSRFRYRYAPAFPGFRRLQFKPLLVHRPLAQNLDALTSYPMKLHPPSTAVFGRGSRSCKPRDARSLLFYNRVIVSLGGLRGSLRFDHGERNSEF